MSDVKISAIEKFSCHYSDLKQIPIMRKQKEAFELSFKEDIIDSERFIFLPIRTSNVEKVGFLIKHEGQTDESVRAMMVELEDFTYNASGVVKANKKRSLYSDSYSLKNFNIMLAQFNEEISDYDINTDKVISCFKTIFNIK
ncbi:hypothetical protein [Serratia sp. Se-RSBMAAmG]|uniref:hypothetical protein n=1 Tax=Serratia sp. Se-RSBMAAmG TaxID=3043305 RepID=UPI0024AEA83D|nr:hypothetical protein [Serratia sp. Se-RSBMAAmG]MDI6976140.1 hypothetical protein [Serratia sp. Se-RSBMAAmG]